MMDRDAASDPDNDDEDYHGVDEGDDEDAIMEDEEDDGEGNVPKRKKQKKNQFIDDIAEDEDDLEAEDEDEGPEEQPDEDDMNFLAEDDDEAAEADKLAREISKRDREREKKRMERRYDDDIPDLDSETMHAALDQERDQQEAARITEAIAAKYGNVDSFDGDDDGRRRDASELNESALLPSIKDPRLFLVKCDPGKENDMVLALMQKYNIKENSKEDKLYIHSAFTTPASKGYVYIEAEKDVHVKRAIRGLRALKWWKILIVPIKEMVSAVKFQDDITTVKPKQWVRMKRGIYNGDLAQVVKLSDQNTVITVKLIPRLDLAAIEQQVREKNSDIKSTKKRGRFGFVSSVRPQAQLFNPNEVKALGAEVMKKHGFYIFGSNRYRHGFLYKDTNIQALTIDGVVPTQDEIDRFQAKLTGDDDEEDGEEDEPERSHSGPITTSTHQRAVFSMGDRVIVCEGEMKNITGIVTSIGKNTATITPDRQFNINMSVELTHKQLKKYFRLGDHIKVVTGAHKNETGLITQVKEVDDSVIFYSDISLKEIKVSAQDVIESSEVSTGQDSLGNYELHDLVQLTGDVVGVIVKVELASFKVLSNRGIVTTVRLQEIGKKRNSRTATALDSQNCAITRDDVVKVLSGPHQSRQGTVLHIYRSSIFIHSRTYMENSGIFVVQAKHVALVGQNAINAKPKVPASPYIGAGQVAAMPPPKPQERGAPRGGFGIDPFVGKTVMVVKGQYKGYMGIVKEVNDAHCRVELHALARTVPIKRDMMKLREDVVKTQPHPRDAYFSAQTPLIGAKTPAWGSDMGSATPAHPGLESGSMTPAYSYGSRTPSRSAFAPQTPSHDAWTPATPGGRSGRANPRTPAADSAESEFEREMQQLGSQRTPGGPITPRNPNTPSNPITPRADDTPYDDEDEKQTPRLTPHTPYQHTPTPHTPGARYTTPHTPHTPAPHTPAPQTPGGGMAEEEEEDTDAIPSTPTTSGTSGEPLPVGVMVWCRDAAAAARDDWENAWMGSIAKVTSTHYMVKPDTQQRNKSVLHSNVKPITPEKGHTVIVLAGPNQGQVGVLIGIDGTEGLVRANDILMVQMSSLSRYLRPSVPS